MTWEPLDPDESRGIEFVVINDDGKIDFWSIKRQTTKAAGWTLSTLAANDDRGRSIFGDLLAHVERGLNHRAVLASTLGARDFQELCDCAETKGVFEARLARSIELKTDFEKYLLPLCGGDMELAADAQAMASEHLLVLADGRYRFFHETFFDYAFARRFAAGGGRLVEMLLDGEQHLFRRAQVRQVLAYLRTHDEQRYLEELDQILTNSSVRFHIKSPVFQWLSSLPDPRRQDWMAGKKPDMACEAIGRWFDRAIATWRSHQLEVSEAPDISSSRGQDLRAHLNKSGSGDHVIHEAAKSALRYVEVMLPRIAEIVDETIAERGDRLGMDAVWSFRSFGDSGLQIHEVLLSGLAIALEVVAKEAPAELDRLLEPYQDRPHDTIAYLVLRALTAAPGVYADRLADYLTTDPRRLKVGYLMWGGQGGSAANYVSAQAVRASSSGCSSERCAALEQTITSLSDAWEAQNPPARGLRQLELLEALEASRLGAAGRSMLDELRRKFPAVTHDAPTQMSAAFVGSPVPEDAQAKMSDEQWLRAMQKYAGTDHGLDRGGRLSGGEYQLAQALERRAQADPVRFAALAERMPDDLPASNFDAILRGVANGVSAERNTASVATAPDHVVSLLRRVHALPNHPCGRSIAWLIEKLVRCDWPEDVMDAVAWYAVNDPDPSEERWKEPAPDGQVDYEGDPYFAGINSTRGVVALAVARLLFDDPGRVTRLHDAVHSLVYDRSIAVRSCAIRVLLAMPNIDAPKAISWFNDCVTADPALLATPDVERFIYFAGYRDYDAVRPVVDAMLTSLSPKVVEAGARQVCRLALRDEAAEADAERVRGGTPAMRKAAADVYATDVAQDIVGPTCRRLLKPFFADPDDEVRKQAAVAFQELASLATPDQTDLLSAFLDTAPSRAALEPVVRALEESPVQLPHLVIRLAEMSVDAYRDEAGDISKAGSMVATTLSKIVIRLYAQTEDASIRSRCLSLIDEMERHHFSGLSDELRRLERS